MKHYIPYLLVSGSRIIPICRKLSGA